jgi:ABC-2 type transport system permease protein
MFGFITIFKNDLRIMIKDLKALLMLLILPVIVILIFSSALAPLLEHSNFIEPFKIVLVDNDKSPWTGLLASQLRNLDIIEKIIFADEDEARRLIENDEAAAAIIIPENLSESIDYWEPKAGKVLGSNTKYLESRLVKNIGLVGSDAVSTGLSSLSVIYDIDTEKGYAFEEALGEINRAFDAFVNLVLNRKAVISEEKADKPGTDPVIYYAMSLMAVFIMFSSIPCMRLLTDERRLGILSRLNASPVRSFQTTASKLLLSFLISAAQFVIILIFIRIAGESGAVSSMTAMIPVFLATSFAAGAFSIFVASISSTGSAADLIANLSILLMAIVGGSLYPLSSLPAICRKLSVVTINRWSSQGFLNAVYSGVTRQTMYSVAVLAAMAFFYLACASLVLSVRRRRVEG